MSALPIIKSLWIGPALSRLERIALSSFVAAGHEVQLFTYGSLDVPEGITIRDGRDILPEAAIIRRRGNGGIEPFADLFRYVLVGLEGGIWVDTDQVCLKPFAFSGDAYVMGWQGGDLIANGVYGAPPDSALARHLLQIGRDPPRLPRWAGATTLLRVIAGVATGGHNVADAPWGTYGPALFTAAVRRFGLEEQAQPPDVFYPLPWAQADLLFEEAWQVEARLTDRTLGLHLWNHMIAHRKKEPFPQGSYLAALARRLL